MPAEWPRALPGLASVPIVLVIGPAEAGKTTFTAWLATALHARGFTVAIVDADVGQSEIGPPATVGLGRVTRPLARPAEADLVAFEFVGVTSPGRRPSQVVEATGRLGARARAEFQRVVVDTSGFVAGGFAAAVKQRKIAAVDPDIVVVIQHQDEAEHITRALAARARPRVVRLPGIPATHPRTPAERRRHREAALARHLHGAGLVGLEARRIAVRALTGEPLALAGITAGAIVAVHAGTGETIGLGIVDSIDLTAGKLVVLTTRSAREIAAVTVGETTAA